MVNIHVGVKTAEGFEKQGGMIVDTEAIDTHLAEKGLTIGLNQNAITGYYHARGHGVASDATNGPNNQNNTILQAMINSIIAIGGGTLYFDYVAGTENIYRFDQLKIEGQGDMNITLKAAPGVALRAAPLLTTDAIIVKSDTLTPLSGYIRSVTFEDIVLQGQLDFHSGTKIPRRGFYVKCGQNIHFNNVKIAQFQKGALVLDDSFDNYFNDVEIKWSGYGDSPADYAYALQFLGAIDNSNNNRFTNLHLEFCPLEITFEHNARQNFFTNFKFEHGGETYQNASGLSPIYFKAAIENYFVNGQIVQGNSPETYHIKADDNTDSYLTTFNVRQNNRFTNTLFFANSMNKARWFTGFNTIFNASQFQRTNGETGAYGFNFLGGCRLVQCNITLATAAANVFRIDGENNVIEAPQFTTVGSPTGVLFNLISTATKSLITDWTTKGSAPSAITSSLTYFGDNVFSDRRTAFTDATGGGTKSVLGKSFIKFTDVVAMTYTTLAHGHNGQRVALYTPRTDLITIQHGTGTGNIALKSGSNKLMSINETIELINIDGVWREL